MSGSWQGPWLQHPGSGAENKTRKCVMSSWVLGKEITAQLRPGSTSREEIGP